MKPKHYAIIAILVLLGLSLYFQIDSVKKFKCQGTLGKELNARRQKLKIPLIPANWVIKDRDDIITAWWPGKDDSIGHRLKIIGYKGCDLVVESDIYSLKTQNGKQRGLRIKYVYASAQHRDSIKYTYQIDSLSKPITQTQADSLLKAENISRD